MSKQGAGTLEENPRISEATRRYRLSCRDCGASLEDDGVLLNSSCCQSSGLLRTVYPSRELKMGPAEEGLFRFADWLPVVRHLKGSASPITFKSRELGARLGLEHLWITFTGYWPEREAWTHTGTFKENEAYTVCARLPRNLEKILVVASAGNTARAFGHVCSQNSVPNLLIVPEFALDQLWFQEELAPCVQLVAVRGDYTDAIQLSNAVSNTPGFIGEGGARNVARRDGMGTTFLSAVTSIGEIPHHYFQAIGSGTGVIAAWEAGMRLRADGAWGTRKTRLHVAQNIPFVPMINSWEARSRTLLLDSEEIARKQIGQISAKVLANRTPAYSMSGGLYEAMTDSGGEGYAVSNDQAEEAFRLFQELEGIDPSPAASVAIAALQQAVDRGTIDPKEIINLNVTGGGLRRRRNGALQYLRPSLTVDGDTQCDEALLSQIAELFS